MQCIPRLAHTPLKGEARSLAPRIERINGHQIIGTEWPREQHRRCIRIASSTFRYLASRATSKEGSDVGEKVPPVIASEHVLTGVPQSAHELFIQGMFGAEVFDSSFVLRQFFSSDKRVWSDSFV